MTRSSCERCSAPSGGGWFALTALRVGPARATLRRRVPILLAAGAAWALGPGMGAWSACWPLAARRGCAAGVALVFLPHAAPPGRLPGGAVRRGARPAHCPDGRARRCADALVSAVRVIESPDRLRERVCGAARQPRVARAARHRSFRAHSTRGCCAGPGVEGRGRRRAAAAGPGPGRAAPAARRRNGLGLAVPADHLTSTSQPETRAWRRAVRCGSRRSFRGAARACCR